MAGEQDETSEDLVIDVVDFHGTRVVCDAQRWTAKVDEHHFELIGAYAEVSETIANPDTVLQDPTMAIACTTSDVSQAISIRSWW